jgi:hypothetical protein
MHLSLPSILLALVCGETPQAHYRTPNFVVQADTPEVAKLVGESAERWRKNLAKLWLNKAQADWSSPCRVRVCIDVGMIAGLTDVEFAEGRVRSHQIDLQGPLDRVLKGPLPHELTHVLFAHHFGTHPPRWADEGGAILSEDNYQRERQSRLFRKGLAEERWFPLRKLFDMQQYPPDVSRLYAQGHSVCRFLVDAKDRKTFLAFVKDGIGGGWDQAARNEYGYENVEQLEKAWLAWAAKPLAPGTAASLHESSKSDPATALLDSARELRMVGTRDQIGAFLLHYR